MGTASRGASLRDGFPDDVALIEVDDDLEVCERTHPGISKNACVRKIGDINCAFFGRLL